MKTARLPLLLWIATLFCAGSAAAAESGDKEALASFRAHIANLSKVEDRGGDVKSGWTEIAYDVKRSDSLVTPFVGKLKAIRVTGKDAKNSIGEQFVATLGCEDSKWALTALEWNLIGLGGRMNAAKQGDSMWKALNEALGLK